MEYSREGARTVRHSFEREMDCGQIEGMTEEQRIKKWGSNWRELDLGMESFDDVARRGVVFIEETCDTYKEWKCHQYNEIEHTYT